MTKMVCWETHCCIDRPTYNSNTYLNLILLNSLYGRHGKIFIKIGSLDIQLPCDLILKHMSYNVNKLLRDLIHVIMNSNIQLFLIKKCCITISSLYRSTRAPPKVVREVINFGIQVSVEVHQVVVSLLSSLMIILVDSWC